MGLLLAALAGLVTIGLIIWRVSLILRAGSEAVEVAHDVKQAVRRHQWRNKQIKGPVIEAVTEPTLAATVIILLIIKSGHGVNDDLLDRLAFNLQDVFACDKETAENLVGEADYVTRDLVDDRRWVGRLTNRVLSSCRQEEKRDIPKILFRVIAEDSLSDAQKNLLSHYKNEAGL